MPASLIKLFLSASNVTSGDVTTTTTPNVDANVRRFVATVTDVMKAGGTTTIPDASFLDDDGNAVAAGGLPVPTDGFINVYINAVLQQEGLSNLTTTQLVINDDTIQTGIAVVLEVTEFSGSTATSASTHNITIATTINS